MPFAHTRIFVVGGFPHLDHAPFTTILYNVLLGRPLDTIDATE